MLERLSRLSARTKSHWLADDDLKRQQHTPAGVLGLLSLAFASIGVIYGDIGTSPLYVYSTIFTEAPQPQDVLCAASLVFWSITLVVLVKYVLIVLLADDNGEGGTFALYATLSRVCNISATSHGHMPADQLLYQQAHPPSKAGSTDLPTTKLPDPSSQASTGGKKLSSLGAFLKRQLSTKRALQHLLLFVTLVMAAMVLGDGVLTPCISVLSAVQGLQQKAGFNQDVVIGITCAILVLLFLIQGHGTQRVGVMFAPTILLWFISNMLVALYNIHTYEGASIFRALSPHYIVVWFQNNGTTGWMKLAGVFLCLTGCEAMFADLGHFNRSAVRLSFTTLAYPSLVLTYLGQASWLMHNTDGYSAVFYNSIPQPVFWPIFVISVAAAIVASQALITGSFSIVSQSMALGCFPRVQVKHTSDKVGGQIYIGTINWLLMVLCIAVVAGFQSGTAIGNAYGIAVNLVMFSTVFFVSLVMLVVWGTHPVLVAAFFLPFAFIEGAFLSANLLNIPHGGWFSITMASVITLISALWIYGSAQKRKGLQRLQFQLGDVLTVKRPDGRPAAPDGSPGLTASSWQLYRVSNMSPVQRSPGMALVYSESPFQVPAVFKRLVESWGVHSTVVFVTVRQVPVPHVSVVDRLLLAPMEFKGFYRCVARYGYMDKVDQGPRFVQSVLDKIAQVAPNAAISDGLTPKDPTALRAPEGPAATPAAAAGTPASAHYIGAAPCTVVAPGSNPQTAADGQEITPAAAAFQADYVSELASRAVYVLQRAMIRTLPSGSPAMSFARRVVLEQLYQPMWLITTRFWENVEAPVNRVFEVGMMVEL